MGDIERLIAIEAIKRLKAAYFRCMDERAWDEFATLFTDDVIFDARGALEMPKPDDEYEEEPIVGASAVVDYARTGLTPLISVHSAHMAEIDILDSHNARGTWPMHDMLIAPPGAPFRIFRGWGHYRETYRKTGDRWQIATLRLRRLYVQTE
ncbi:nuclear transport factor 2 family protein [Rhizorhabdus argentea]|uniref:nuclear transport factor 2 family protein n=1 Tax=Rhizorhabdus argentea TaxID=1387174 RepID=UPI0030EE0254